MGKLLALFSLFRKGNVVADPELWKHGGAALQAALVPFLLTLVATICTVFGFCVDVSPATAAGIAGGIVALVGVCVTYITSDKVGIPGLAPAEPVARTFDARLGAIVDTHLAPARSEPAKPVAPVPVRPWTEADREAP